MNKALLVSGSLILLAACTAVQTPSQWQPQRDWTYFEAQGRIGVRINDKGSYANFDWLKQYGVETIDINTPLGNTVGQLCQDSEGVLAKDGKGQVYTADTAEALSQMLLGYELPLQHLGVWANGEWVNGIPHSFSADGRLQQSGWRISRETGEQGALRVLTLENDTLNVRMVFDESNRSAGQPERQERCAARIQAA